MSRLDIDMTEFKEFFGKMEQFAKGQFKEELIEYVDTIGFDFLRVVQDEIVRRKIIDTRLLLASFEKGSAGAIKNVDLDNDFLVDRELSEGDETYFNVGLEPVDSSEKIYFTVTTR